MWRSRPRPSSGTRAAARSRHGSRGGTRSIYLRDTGTGQTTLVGDRAPPPDDASTMPAVSADGRFVAFVSRATNLVARDRNKSSDVFLYDVETGCSHAGQSRRRRRRRQRCEPQSRDLGGRPVGRVPVRCLRHGLRTKLPAWDGRHQSAPRRVRLQSHHWSDLAGQRRPPAAPGWRRAPPRRSTRAARWWCSPPAIRFPRGDVLERFRPLRAEPVGVVACAFRLSRRLRRAAAFGRRTTRRHDDNDVNASSLRRIVSRWRHRASRGSRSEDRSDHEPRSSLQAAS